jgi:hypothetical protein
MNGSVHNPIPLTVMDAAYEIVERWLKAGDTSLLLNLRSLRLTALPSNLPLHLVLRIDCSYNHLTKLKLPAATRVNCSDNHLTELNLPAATYVYCWNNDLTELSLPAATEVYCSNNHLTELNLPAATYVYCSNNLLLSKITTAPNCRHSVVHHTTLAYHLSTLTRRFGSDAVVHKWKHWAKQRLRKRYAQMVVQVMYIAPLSELIVQYMV